LERSFFFDSRIGNNLGGGEREVNTFCGRTHGRRGNFITVCRQVITKRGTLDLGVRNSSGKGGGGGGGGGKR